jgi:hypothetical protein
MSVRRVEMGRRNTRIFVAVRRGAYVRWLIAAVDENGRKERLGNAFVSLSP